MDTLEPTALSDRFDDVETLEEFLSRPSRALIDDMKRLDGDVLILGVGGKMGPTLARLAKRAAPEKRIVGVARFSQTDLRDRLEGQGIETIACDLLDREVVVDLPRLRNVVFMAGRKFGSTGAEELTWAMNAWVPTIVAETFTDSRGGPLRRRASDRLGDRCRADGSADFQDRRPHRRHRSGHV